MQLPIDRSRQPTNCGMSTTNIDEWKTISLGTHKSTEGMFQDLRRTGCKVTDAGYELLTKVPLASPIRRVPLARVYPEQFGVRHAMTLNSLFHIAQWFGLERVPAEVGPELRLQYRGQPKGECLLIAMTPVGCSNYPHIFCVTSRGQNLWLDAECGYLGHFWEAHTAWVFLNANSNK